MTRRQRRGPNAGWLGTHYRKAFEQADMVVAATFSVAAGLLRPIGGYIIDLK